MGRLNYQNFKHKINEINDPDILSITLIGSYALKRNLKNINDIDLLIVIKNLNKKEFERVIKKFSKIKNSFSNKKTEIVLETRKGPIKPIPRKGKKVVQIHLLIWDKKQLIEKIRNPILLDALNFGKTLYGLPLKETKNVQKLNKKDLIKDLNINLKGIKTKVAWIGEFETTKKGFIEKGYFLDIPKEKHLEIISNSIITSFMNFSRYKNPTIKKSRKVLLKKGKNLLEKEYFEILKKSFIVKENLEKGNLGNKNYKNLEKEGIRFIEHLKSLI